MAVKVAQLHARLLGRDLMMCLSGSPITISSPKNWRVFSQKIKSKKFVHKSPTKNSVLFLAASSDLNQLGECLR